MNKPTKKSEKILIRIVPYGLLIKYVRVCVISTCYISHPTISRISRNATKLITSQS